MTKISLRRWKKPSFSCGKAKSVERRHIVRMMYFFILELGVKECKITEKNTFWHEISPKKRIFAPETTARKPKVAILSVFSFGIKIDKKARV